MTDKGGSSSSSAVKPETVTIHSGSVRFDGLPKLEGQSNYVNWAAAWQLALDTAEWWEVVSGEDPMPTSPGKELKNWLQINKRAKFNMMTGAVVSLQPLITAAPSAKAAWDVLKNKYDKENPVTTFSIMEKAFYTKMAEGSVVSDHITSFHNNWQRLTDRCAKKADKLTTALSYVANEDAAKAALFLMSLPKSMTHIVDNLQTIGDLSYEDITAKLENMNSANQDTDNLGDDKAFSFNNRSNNNNNNNNYRDSYQRDRGNNNNNGNNGDKECTWCKSRKERVFTGHIYSECNKLKKHQEERKAKKEAKQEDSASTLLHDSATTIAMVRTHSPSSPLSPWILDSGATSHVTPHADQLHDVKPHSSVVRTADGTIHRTTGIGRSTLRVRFPDGRIHTVILTDVLLVPSLGNQGLISETVLDQKGFRSMSGGGRKTIRDKEGKEIIWAKLEKGLWNVQLVENTVRFTTYSDWHKALGHSTTVTANFYSDKPTIPNKPTNFHCNTCALAKSTHKVPKATGIRSKKPLELIHSDLSGRFATQSLGKALYYISFIDDFTRYSWIYFLKEKSDTHKAIKTFVTRVEKQYDAKVKKFRNDNGGEYINDANKNYFSEKGIEVETSPPYSHESNGVAERFNRTITNMVRCMIMNHPKTLWGEAFATAVYLKNRLPHSALKDKNLTPFEALKGNKPSINHLIPFGRTSYVHIPVESRPPGTKLAPRADEGIFVGYTDSDKIVRIWVPSKNKVVTTRHVTYGLPESEEVSADFEISLNDETPKDERTEHPSESDIDLNSETGDSEIEEATEVEQSAPGAPRKPRRSTRERKQAVKETQLEQEKETMKRLELRGIQRRIEILNMDFKDEEELIKHMPENEQKEHADHAWEIYYQKRKALGAELERTKAMTVIHDHPLTHFVHLVAEEPTTYNQAINSPEGSKWKNAIEAEIDALSRNHTWDIVERPTNRAIVGGKWVFKIKHLADGRIDKYKARYVAKGFTQIPGQDFDETFAPVARYDSQRLLLALSAHHKWVPQQMDIKSAFLYGVLKEEIYMELPDGFREGTKVCKLRKCIYGLKQSPREWYSCLSDSLVAQGFRPANFDPCVFIHPENNIYLAVYVDDIMIYGPDNSNRTQVKNLLKTDFECTDLGNAKSILGLEINVETDGSISLSQSGYISKILEKFGMQDSRPVGSPLEPNTILVKGEVTDELVDKTNYQSIIGSLMYASIGTRPDLTHAVTFLSQFSSCPTEDHLRAAKRVLRYLNGTKHSKLTYPSGGKLQLDGFSDSSYASNLTDRKSFSGYIFRLGQCAISWRSRKQKSVAVSTTEAEYMALSLTTRQLVWLQNALKELNQECHYYIHADNTGSIELSRNPRIHDRSKHIDVHYHYTREQLELGTFELLYVPTENNLADILTKGLPKPTHQRLSDMIRCNK